MIWAPRSTDVLELHNRLSKVNSLLAIQLRALMAWMLFTSRPEVTELSRCP